MQETMTDMFTQMLDVITYVLAAIAGVSLVTAFLGRTAIGFIVDVATIGAAIAYAYTSAAAFRTARGPGGHLARVTGACGLVTLGADPSDS